MEKALGHVFKYGDNVDTDVIIPARYLIQRACSTLPEDGRSKLYHCRDICKDLLQKRDQYRTSDH